MRTLCNKALRCALLATLVAVIITLAAVNAAADDFTAAAILSADGIRTDYVTMDAAMANVQPGDTLVILHDWVPTESVTFPAGVTVLIPGYICAGNETADICVTVLGTLKSAGTLVGTWQLKSYVTISWDTDGDGTIDERQVLYYGDMPTHEDGYRPRNGANMYTFIGWDKTIVPATEDVTYTARFTRSVSNIAVKWDLDGDGTADVSETYTYGDTPTPPCDGSRPDDVAKTYTFIGWDKDIQAAVDDVTYTAVFAISSRTYTVYFDTDGDGAVDEQQSLHYGDTPTHEDGYRSREGAYEYTFICWDQTFFPVTEDVTYTARFTRSISDFVIGWDTDGDGTIDERQVLYYGDMPTHEDGYRPRNGAYVYTFIGWDKTIVPATEDVTYTARFTSSVSSVVVKWDLDGDGTADILKTYTYGDTPTPPCDGSRPDDVAKTYTFIGWDKDIQAAVDDVTYTAVFSDSPRTYTVYFDTDGDGAVDEQQSLHYGDTPTHEDGYRSREGAYEYKFIGWDQIFIPVTEDVTYTARFTRSISDFVVRWDLDDDGTAEVTETYTYGDTPTAPGDGSRPDDVAKTYTFIGWDKEIQVVTADVTYTAVFSASSRTYNVHLDTDGDGAIDVTLDKTYGSPLMPEDGQKDTTEDYSFVFTGWLPALEDVTGDAVYYAQFAAVSKQSKESTEGVFDVSMLNMRETELSLLVTLENDGVIYAVQPVTAGAGMNNSFQFTALPDGTYTLVITDVETGGCLLMNMVTIADGTGNCSIMMSGKAPVFNVNIDDTLPVIALDIPQSWLNRDAATAYAGLTAQDWKSETIPALSLDVAVLDADAPFHETLEVAAGEQKIGLLLQVTLSKTVDDKTTELSRVSDVVTMLISVDDVLQDQADTLKDSMTIWRVSGSTTDELTTNPNIYGEYFAWEDDGTLRLCLRTGGTFALAYDVPSVGFPLWWILLLFDVAGAFVLYIDRRRLPLDYPVRLGVALFLTVVVVTVLAIRQSVTEIVFASIGWLILTLLICWSGTGNRSIKVAKNVSLKSIFGKDMLRSLFNNKKQLPDSQNNPDSKKNSKE